MNDEIEADDWTCGRQKLLERCKLRAFSCLKNKEYSRAFAHFIVALTVQPDVKSELLNVFLFTLEKISSDFEKNKQVNEVLMCYEQALEVLPSESHILHGLGATLFRLGYIESALSYFLKSYKANPFFTPSLYCMENLKNALIERWHFTMLNDYNRNRTYKKAIENAVKQGYDCVLDIGAGTGILSIMASNANASKVYACESSEIMCAVLNDVVKLNGRKIHIIPKMSMDIKIPEDISERVSLIITEIFDAGLFGEHCLETIDHAWRHLLLENCDNNDTSLSEETKSSLPQSSSSQKSKVIPASATVYIVPVECEHFSKFLKLDHSILQSLGIMEPVNAHISDEPYSSEKLQNLPCGYSMLSEPIPLLEVNFNSPAAIRRFIQGEKLEKTFCCSQSGKIDAIVMWFQLNLDDELSLSTAPCDESDDSCWEQAVYYAVPKYFEGSSSVCSAGDKIDIEFFMKGHLQLQKIKVHSDISRGEVKPILTLDPTLIYLLNSYSTNNLIDIELNKIADMECSSVLDLSAFPILALKYLKEHPTNTATVLQSQYQEEIWKILGLFDVKPEQLKFKSYEDLCLEKEQYDVLIVDPVELCGLLKKNVIEDVRMLRMQCLKKSSKVIPGEIDIYAVVVQSQPLREQSKVVSDGRADGLKISEVMNAYQCFIHQDIQFSTLQAQLLTTPVKLCSVSFNSDHAKFNGITGTLAIDVTNTGKPTAVIYWFSIKYSRCIVDTYSPKGLWKQAAFILDEDITLEKGQKVSLQYSLNNSCLQIRFCDNLPDST